MFQPELWSCLRSCSRKQLLTDLLAGAVVGVVALPLAMAFAIASGVAPEKGLYTAIVAGFLISALGGSRVQIGGPTGAFVVLVFGIVEKYGLDGLALCTLMAGGMVLLMGLLRLGAAIKFVPYPVITGFTSGIAVIIFSSQIKDLLGLTTGKLPGEVYGKWEEYLASLHTINWFAVDLSALTIVLIVGLRKVSARVPAPLVAMLAVTALVQVFAIPVETIGSRFGELPSGLPTPQLPAFSMEKARELFSPAVTVALLTAIESLLSAMVADGMIGTRHNPNQELIAQGIANLLSPIFGGIPATGAIARTATNVKNGARTPIAGIVHALTLLLIVLAFGRWASLVPMCCLAGILVVVAYHMSEWRTFRNLLHAPRGDVLVLLTTFVLTVVIDLSVAVQVGVVLAMFLFAKRMADMTKVGALGQVAPASQPAAELELDGDPEAISKRTVPAGVQVYEIHGPFCFAAADKLRSMMPVFTQTPRVLILRLRHVPVIDATGLYALTQFQKECAARGAALVLSGVQPHVCRKLERWPETEAIGAENIVPDIDRALVRATAILTGSPLPGGRKTKHKKRVA